jgi:predicted DNA-binding protein YlxM (UPF0122 family)
LKARKHKLKLGFGESMKPFTSKTRLSNKQWVQIRTRYLAGDNMTQIAGEYKIPRNTIHTKARRQQWGKHGSRRDAIAIKIAEETECEIRDEFKEKVKKLNKEHLASLKRCSATAEKIMEIADIIINYKLRRMREFDAAGLDIPDDCSLYEIAKVVATVSRTTLALIGRNITQILGIEHLPIFMDLESKHGLNEMTKIFERGVDRVIQLKKDLREQIKKEEIENIRAEAMAETDIWAYALQ